MKNLLFSVVAVVLLAGPVAAQTVARTPPVTRTELYELVLKDGSRVFGTIESETDAEVVVRTPAGAVITARRADVASLQLASGRIESGEFLHSDRHRTRLFFAPTARSLKRGEVSFGVFQFIAPFVQVGVTDRISVGGGTPLLFGFEDWERPFWFTPKVQVVNTPNVQGAVGLLHVFDVSGDGAGIAYGVGTIGNSDNAFTGGAGLTYAGDSRGWVVMGGAEGRISRGMKLMTENYVWQNGEGIVSGGIRFLGDRLSADLALAVPVGVGGFYAFPVINFVYVF